MNCRECGEPNAPDLVQCVRCGRPLAGTPSERAAAPTVVAREPTLVEGPGGTVAPAPTLSAEARPGELHDLPTLDGSSKPRTSASGELAPLSLFGSRYEILELVGEGGMGRVYKARDRELDRTIALKTIRSETGGGDATAVQRFKQELLLARKITHKNVVRIHDLGEADGVKFFTMEFVEGESLHSLIRRRGRIPPAEAVPLARQILGALEEAHAQGVIHRDLKPQNVMLDRSGTAYLMDFGIARSVDAEGMTATGAIVGTPDYLSPEQVRGDKITGPSDLFSFGIILYEMLTGELPYRADSAVSKIMMRLTHKPRSPRELSHDIPRYLESAVLKCMEVDPALRYRSASEILDDLGREQVGRSVTMRIERAVVRRKGTFAAIAAVMLVVAAAAYWAGRRPAPAGEPSLQTSVQTLAIVPFTNAAGSPELEWMRTGLPEMLVTDLSQSRYVRPVPGERVFRVLREAGLAGQSRFDEAALESVSKRAPAQSVLSGQFLESGGRLRLDLTLRKAGSGVPVPLKVEGVPSEVFALVDEITRRVKEQLDIGPEQLRGDADRPVAEVSTASFDALRSYQAALAQIRRGANQDAIPLLESATKADPSFAVAFAKLAEAYLSLGQPEPATAAIERARALSERAALPLAERYQIHATAALVKDDYETAARSYGELAKLYPDDPDIRMSLARALEEAGQLPEALKAYEAVVRTAPEYGAALLGLGRLQVMSGHPDEAIRSLRDALATKQFEDEPEALGMIHSILGVAHRETGKLDKAIEHLTLSLELRRKSGDKRGQAATLYNLATVHEFLGDVDKALAAERQALALARELKDRAEESKALSNLAGTYEVAGKLEQALAAYRESLQIEMERQDHVDLANRLNHIANIYRLQGRYEDAVVYLEQAKSHSGQSDDQREKAINLNYTGQVRKAQGLYDQALEAFRAALPLFHEIGQEMGVAMVQHDLSEIYSSQGRYADAYAALGQSFEIYRKLHVEHDIAEVKVSLGHLLASLGLAEEAEKEIAEAERMALEAKAEGLFPEILLARAEVAELRGKHKEAAAALAQAEAKAGRGGRKDVAVEARIELGRLYVEEGRLADAGRLLLSAREDASRSRLRPLEAEATAALAELHLAKKDAEGARREASEAVRLSESFAGRPVAYQALSSLAEAQDRLGRAEEALEAYAKAVATLEWIRGGLRPEHVGPFMGRRDVKVFLEKALPRLEKGGRTADAASLRKWANPAPR